MKVFFFFFFFFNIYLFIIFCIYYYYYYYYLLLLLFICLYYYYYSYIVTILLLLLLLYNYINDVNCFFLKNNIVHLTTKYLFNLMTFCFNIFTYLKREIESNPVRWNDVEFGCIGCVEKWRDVV